MAPSEHPDQADAQEFRSYGADPRQLDMFGSPPERSYDPDPDEVRAELLELLARARAAPEVPWPAKEVSFYRTVFPQMANWLPDEEAARLRRDFAAEIARLEAV